MGADYSRIRGTLGMGQEKWAPTTAGHRDFGFGTGLDHMDMQPYSGKSSSQTKL